LEDRLFKPHAINTNVLDNMLAVSMDVLVLGLHYYRVCVILARLDNPVVFKD